MKNPKHTALHPVRTPAQLSRMHTAFVKAVALGDAPSNAARRIAKNPEHASQLLTRYTRDPATHHAIAAEIEELLNVHALPLAVSVILETLRAGGPDAKSMAKFVYKCAQNRIAASDTAAGRKPQMAPTRYKRRENAGRAKFPITAQPVALGA